MPNHDSNGEPSAIGPTAIGRLVSRLLARTGYDREQGAAGLIEAWQQAVAAVRVADLLVVVGTSALVHPAAGLPDLAPNGTTIIEINPKPTPLSDRATISLREKASTGLARLRLDAPEYGLNSL